MKVDLSVVLMNEDEKRSRGLDTKFGRGPRGGNMIMSKVIGAIYFIMTSLQEVMASLGRLGYGLCVRVNVFFGRFE